MKLSGLKSVLRAHPEALSRFILPDGDHVPAHFHITEVGHVAKRFIDCGGRLHDTTDTCLLQTHVGDDVEHRLRAGRFAKILDLGAKVLASEDLEVEVEYDCCVVAQYPIATVALTDAHLEFQLGKRHTACLAKQECGSEAGCASAACC